MQKTNLPKSDIIKSSTAKFWNFPKWIALVFLFISFGLYIQTWNYEYVLDDQIVITGNTFTQKGIAGIKEIFSTESFQGYFGEQKDLLPGSRYRPLSIATFAIENQFFGNNPSLNHLVNILLYFLSTLFLFRILLFYFPKLKNQKWYFNGAFLIALLWLVHPTHTEAVANIKGRDEILSLLFSLLAWWASYKWLIKSNVLNLISSFAFLFLGLLAKESAITFAGIIPVALYFHKKQFAFKRLLLLTLPLIISSVLYLVIRYLIIGYFLDSGKELNDIMNNPFLGMSFAEKYATIMYTLLLYLKLSFFPYPLTHDYYPDHIPTINWSDIRSWISLLVYSVLSIIALIGIKKKSLFALAISIYIMALSVASNLLINVGTFMNERFIYAASIGPCIAIVAGIFWVSKKSKFNFSIGPIICYLFIAAFTTLSFIRIPAWENQYTLNNAAIKVSKNSARANSFMATALYKKIKSTNDRKAKLQLIKDTDFYANKAVAIMPNYQNANLMKAGAAAEMYQIDRDVDKLLASFKIVASSRPEISFMHEYFEYIKDREDHIKLCAFYYEIGYKILFEKQGKSEWAARYLKYAYELCPNDYQLNIALMNVYNNLGLAENASKFGARAQKIKKSVDGN